MTHPFFYKGVLYKQFQKKKNYDYLIQFFFKANQHIAFIFVGKIQIALHAF